jgi:hypothetical protein
MCHYLLGENGLGRTGAAPGATSFSISSLIDACVLAESPQVPSNDSKFLKHIRKRAVIDRKQCQIEFILRSANRCRDVERCQLRKFRIHEMDPDLA